MMYGIIAIVGWFIIVALCGVLTFCWAIMAFNYRGLGTISGVPNTIVDRLIVWFGVGSIVIGWWYIAFMGYFKTFRS